MFGKFGIRSPQVKFAIQGLWMEGKKKWRLMDLWEGIEGERERKKKASNTTLIHLDSS